MQTTKNITQGKKVMTRTTCKVLLSLVAVLSCASAQAVTIELVPVGNAGNADDITGLGGVDYNYDIGQLEVTSGQYVEFLNAVAATDTYELWTTIMFDDPRGPKIERTGDSGSYFYSVEAARANRPVAVIDWGDAVRFANWLFNGQPTGAQDLSTTEDGSYLLDGANTDAALMAVTRKPGATWVIPTEDEWVKAAFHKNDGVTGNYWRFPTQLNNPAPGRDLTEATNRGNNANYFKDGPIPIEDPYYTTEVGEFELSDSAYGTFDQAGNLHEWNESATDDGTLRGLRGGGWGSGGSLDIVSRFDFVPLIDRLDFGFRLAQVVPSTPNTHAGMLAGAIGNDGFGGFDGSITATAAGSYDDRTPVHAIDGSGLTAATEEHDQSIGANHWVGSPIAPFLPSWIIVDLGQSYTLDEIKFWNYGAGVDGDTGNNRGVKDARIWVHDGPTEPNAGNADGTGGAFDSFGWELFDDVTFTEAPAFTPFGPTDTIDLGNLVIDVVARFVALEITSNYTVIGGTNFAGISEMQFFAKTFGPGNFDMDGDGDGADFLLWQQGLGTIYDANDLTDWENNYGSGIPLIAAVGAVPEPSTLALLALALGVVSLRRSRL